MNTPLRLSQEFDLRSATPSWLQPIAKEDFQAFLIIYKDKCLFYDHCQAFLDSEVKNKENAIFGFAHSCLESDYGRSHIARKKLNFRGYGAVDNNPSGGAFGFDAVDDSIIKISSYIVRDYLTVGGKFATPFTEKEFDFQLKHNKYWAATPKNLARWKEKRLRCVEVKPFTLECLNERYATDAFWDTSIANIMLRFVAFINNKPEVK